MSKKEWIFVGIIWLLSVAVVFLGVHNYRNEIVINQVAQIQQMQSIMQQTNILLNQVNWTPEGINTWKQLGYDISPKLPAQK